MGRDPYPTVWNAPRTREADPLDALRHELLSSRDDDFDDAALAALTEPLSDREQASIVQRLLREQAREADRTRRAMRPRALHTLRVAASAIAAIGVLGLLVTRGEAPAASREYARPPAAATAHEEPPSEAALAMQAALDVERAKAAHLTELGESLVEQAMYEKAEALFRQALALREAVLGPDHEDVADSLSHLASLYQSRNEQEKAELLYFRALEIRPPVAVF